MKTEITDAQEAKKLIQLLRLLNESEKSGILLMLQGYKVLATKNKDSN